MADTRFPCYQDEYKLSVRGKLRLLGGSGNDRGKDVSVYRTKECSGPMKRMKKIIAIASVGALLAPATAVAGSSDEGYSGPGNVVSGLQQGGGGGGGGGGNASQPVKASSQGGKLPFTGADLGVLAAAGGLLAGLGFGLRRLTNRPTQA